MKNNKHLPLTLEHCRRLSALWGPLCEKEDLRFPEYSAAAAFVFRKHYLFVDTSPPFIRGECAPGQFYYTPTVAPEHLKIDALPRPCSLFPFPEHWLPRMRSFHGTQSPCSKESDYLFRAQKFKTMSGRALSSRRNLLHQLERSHVLCTMPLTRPYFADALGVLEKWQERSGKSQEKTDYFPCLEAFEYFDELKFFGQIAYADGKAIGFAIGEMLTSKVALLHFAKGLHDIKGVTPYLYKNFALSLPSTAEWINLEQDLGRPELRQAKKAYAPDQILLKYHLRVAL